MPYFLPNALSDQWYDIEDYDNSPLRDVDELISHLSYLSSIPTSRIENPLKAFFLKQSTEYWQKFSTVLWPWLIEEAKKLPEFFPEGMLVRFPSTFSETNPFSSTCSREEVQNEQEKTSSSSSHLLSSHAVLLLNIHMFLGTTKKQHGNAYWTQYLACWMGENGIGCSSDDQNNDQNNEMILKSLTNTVEVYLLVLFDYFDSMRMAVIANNHDELNRMIGYYHDDNGINSSTLSFISHNPSKSVPIIDSTQQNDQKQEKPSPLLTSNSIIFSSNSKIGLHNVIDISFANKDVSFGRHGTQEEVLIGMSPELSPIVLFTSTLSHTACITTTNTRVVGNYTGYGRTLKYVQHGDKDGERESFWRAVLSIDAMPLDEVDGSTILPKKEQNSPSPRLDRKEVEYYAQFTPAFYYRDLYKASHGFSIAIAHVLEAKKGYDEKNCKSDQRGHLDQNDQHQHNTSNPIIINSGGWGCGAFGGDKMLKFVQQWIAVMVSRQDSGCDDVVLRWNLFDDIEFESTALQFIQYCIKNTLSCEDLSLHVFNYRQYLKERLLSPEVVQRVNLLGLFEFIMTSK